MILVTGGAGYIGSVLVPELLALGHRVRVVDTLWFGNPFPPHERLQVIEGDLRFPDAAWLDDVHAVIHLAGHPNDRAIEEILRVNCLGTWNVYEAARRCGAAPRFASPSASGVWR